MTDAEKSSRESFENYIKIHNCVSKRIMDIISSYGDTNEDEEARAAMCKELHAYSKTMAGMMGDLVLDIIAPEEIVAHMLPTYHFMLSTMRDACAITMDDFVADAGGQKGETTDDVMDHFWDGLDLEEVSNGDY